MAMSSTSSDQPPLWVGLVTMVPGLRGGRPVIRSMRITVGDVLGWLASDMSEAEILEDFPELAEADIRAALAFAAEREGASTGEDPVARMLLDRDAWERFQARAVRGDRVEGLVVLDRLDDAEGEQ